MSAIRDFIQGEAELDDDSAEESYDEETGEVRRHGGARNGVNGHMRDSSEEEEDDDDEEAQREVIHLQTVSCLMLTIACLLKVREGFIVDEEDELDDDERRRRKKKRRREQREEEEANLDEEDLDLIGEANPSFERRPPAQV